MTENLTAECVYSVFEVVNQYGEPDSYWETIESATRRSADLGRGAIRQHDVFRPVRKEPGCDLHHPGQSCTAACGDS